MASKSSVAKRTLRWLQEKASTRKDIANVKSAKQRYQTSARTAAMPRLDPAGKKAKDSIAGFKQNDAKMRQTYEEATTGKRKLSDDNIASLKDLLDGKHSLSYKTRMDNLSKDKASLKAAVDTQRKNANKRLITAAAVTGLTTAGAGGAVMHRRSRKKAASTA